MDGNAQTTVLFAQNKLPPFFSSHLLPTQDRVHSQSQQTLTPSRTSLTQSLTKWGREPPPPKGRG